MRKEPLVFSLIRLTVSVAILFVICMLYWSSLLVEADLRQVKQELATIKDECKSIKVSASFPQPKLQEAAKKEARAHIDPAYPNLLEEDSFYTETLPSLLPKDFVPHGTFHSDNLTKPHSLHPFSGWAFIALWQEMCNVTVGESLFGKFETLSPNMAIKMEEREKDGVPEFWVHLRDQVFWEPLERRFFPDDFPLADHFLKKHQVTAEDFKFWFDAVMNPHNQEAGALTARSYYGDIEEIEVIDPLTFVVRWRSETLKNAEGEEVKRIKYVARMLTGGLPPLASFVYKYFSDGTKIIDDDDYRNSSLWAQNFSQHWAKNVIVSCGRWLFDGMSDQEIKFRRNPNFYSPLANLGEASIYTFRSSQDSIWQDFKSGKTDLHILQADQLAELDDFLNSSQYTAQADANAQLNRLDYLMRAFSYIGWNANTPYFQSAKVRRAMTMAIDRQRIIDQNLNGMGVEITGPFFRGDINAYDPSIKPWPFNPKRARSYLEEEGWYDQDGDGILEKEMNGKRIPFIFSLTYYVKTATTKAICEYIATALKEVGIKCELNGVDIADLSASFESKSFDAIVLGWTAGTPPPDPKQVWHSSGAKLPGSSNAVGFVNEEADQIIEKLQYAYDQKLRQALYYRFDAIIHEEQPYTFLYTPKVALLYRNWLKNVFIPADRQDLIPGANMTEPQSSVFWLQR